MSTQFKAKYMSAPAAGHVYLRFFSRDAKQMTWAALGNLTVRKSEFEDLKRCMGEVWFEEEKT